MKIKLFIGTIFALALLWFLGTFALAQGETPSPYAGMENPFPWADNVTRTAGKATYQASCLSCHGTSGSNISPADFSASSYSNNLLDRPDYYFWVISEGRIDRGMPAYVSALSDEKRWQVLTYIWSLGEGPAKEIPPVVSPPLEHGALPECFRCHTRALTEGHSKLGIGSDACLICHSSTKMGLLRLFDGNDIPRTDSPKLCGQCHSDRYAAWQKGDHGLLPKDSVAAGIPTNVRPKCADCHNPHQPKITLTPETVIPTNALTEDGKLNCLACHVRVLKGHDKLGTANAACWSCHSSTEMTSLHLANDEAKLPLSSSTPLCAQCHQSRYKSWTEGTHGVPAWKEGEPGIFGSEKVKCTNCHDPHQPQMPLVNITIPHPVPAPEPPPPPLQLLAIVGISLLLATVIGIAITRGE